MNTTNIKKIIAREGLIVISIMLLAGVSYYLDIWLMNQEKLYKANAKEIQPGRPVTHHAILTTEQLFELAAAKTLLFPKNTNDDVIRQTIRRDVPNDKGGNYFVWDSPTGSDSVYYDDKGQRVFNNFIYKINFYYVFIFFLIFAYPLYLLVRFVVWAIVTLKEKVEN